MAVAVLILAAPLVSDAQREKKVYRLGDVGRTLTPPFRQAFEQGLRDLGCTPGQNIVIEYRARPRDLPVEQPTRFEFVVNGRAAKALGLSISPALRLRADQIIE